MSLDPKDPLVLEKIAKAIKDGVDPKEFEAILDEVLGTTIPAVDDELEDAYQNEIRSVG
jgi:hypothetical protein